MTKEEIVQMLKKYKESCAKNANAMIQYQKQDEPVSVFTLFKIQHEIYSELLKKIEGSDDPILEKNSLSQKEEFERKYKIYKETILPTYGNDPDKVPPHLEPDYNEGWK